MSNTHADGELAIAIAGIGGAVGSTVVAGLELLRRGAPTDGLCLSGVADLIPYPAVTGVGWDVNGADLLSAALSHQVLERTQIDEVAAELAGAKPWVVPALSKRGDGATRAFTRRIVDDLAQLRAGGTRAVVVFAGPTEPTLADADARWPTPEAFERAVDADDPHLPASALYAYSALTAGTAFANFTPGVGADIAALRQLALQRRLPIAGRDGKTGQTMLKTVLAPAFRSRALKVQGWYSLNLLGNGDGATLRDPDALASKTATKADCLDDLLGYPVDDHTVRIEYYPPRGDAKEAWDNIDLVGFLGQRMQVKVNLLARDSILAAPLVVEIARCLDLATRRGEAGVIEELAYFFKLPMSRDGGSPARHDLLVQERELRAWLAGTGRSIASGGDVR